MPHYTMQQALPALWLFLVKWCSAGPATRLSMWVWVYDLAEPLLWVSSTGITTYQAESASSWERLTSFMTSVLFLYFNNAHVFLCSVKVVTSLLFSFTTKCTGLCSLFLSWMLDFLSTWSPGKILAMLSQVGFLVSLIWHMQSLHLNTGSTHNLPHTTLLFFCQI